MKKRYKLIPPDGRYGYVIVVAASVNLIAISMFFVCFGMIFNDFFIKLKMGAADISVLTGVKALCSAIAGFLTGPLLKILSKRQLALVACVFFNAGVFSAVFINTKVLFIVCQGLLQSVGVGFLYNMSCAMVNDYFVERRMLFMTFMQTLASAATMVAPILVTWSMAEYGYRGTLVIMSAVGLQSFVASMLLHPVSWHMRRVPVDDEVPEKKLLLQTESTVGMNSVPSQTPDLNIDAENEFVEEKVHVIPISSNVFTTWFRTYLDWPLFKRYVCTCGGLALPIAIFSDITYIYFLPKALYGLGWDKDQVKWAFALLGFGDIACRVFIILLSSYLKKVTSHLLYLFGLLLGIACRLTLIWVTEYTTTLAIITMMGVSRCVIVVFIPLVIAEYVGPDHFPSAIGISFMMFGLISIVMGPAIGAIADATQSPTVMFKILIGLMVAVAVAWLFEMWWNKRRAHTSQIS